MLVIPGQPIVSAYVNQSATPESSDRHENTTNLHMRENEGELEKLILRKKQVQKAWKNCFRTSVTGLILKDKNGKSCPEASAEGITKYKR